MSVTTITTLTAAQAAISNYLRAHRFDCGLCGADNKTHHTAECPLSVLVDAARRARATGGEK
jgi:hypothetical protein